MLPLTKSSFCGIIFRLVPTIWVRKTPDFNHRRGYHGTLRQPPGKHQGNRPDVASPPREQSVGEPPCPAQAGRRALRDVRSWDLQVDRAAQPPERVRRVRRPVPQGFAPVTHLLRRHPGLGRTLTQVNNDEADDSKPSRNIVIY